jgi:hypothetical protein
LIDTRNSGLNAGATYSYYIKAYDGAHNYSGCSNTVVVATLPGSQDTTPPVTVLGTAPATFDGANGWFRTMPDITLSSNESGPTYYRWDSDVTTSTYSGTFGGPQGEHTLSYYSVDSALNKENTQGWVFKIDTVALSLATLPIPSADIWGIYLSWPDAADTASGVDHYNVYDARPSPSWIRYRDFLGEDPHCRRPDLQVLYQSLRPGRQPVGVQQYGLGRGAFDGSGKSSDKYRHGRRPICMPSTAPAPKSR